MISIQGRLAVKTITGRFGPFNVGRLTTDVGEFSVKDEKLEQYDEGSYEGKFQISKFRTSTYSYGGRTITELQVDLYDFVLDDMEDLCPEDESIGVTQTVDPVEEEEKVQAQPVETKTAETKPAKPDKGKAGPHAKADSEPAAASESSDETVAPDNADAALFGHLWPLGDVVTLDASVGRIKIREQRARMQQLGYVIDYKTQKWHKDAVSESEEEIEGYQF